MTRRIGVPVLINYGLISISLMFSSCPTTTAAVNDTTTTLKNDVTTGLHDVDKNRVEATARLHDVILQLPVVRRKVAPVKTLESGDVRVEVDVSLNVGSVLYLSDADQTMICSVYIAVEWRDLSLLWDPKDYEGVSMIEVSPHVMWMPALMLINSQDPVNLLSLANNLFLYHNGLVRVMIYYKTVTLCTMDHSKFPYDSQVCGFVLESPSPCCKINLTYQVMDQKAAASLIVQSNWELESVQMTDVFGTEFPSMRLRLRRRTVYFTVCLVLPMVLTSYMNVLVFLLPVGCGEKFSFLVSLYVSTSLFISFFKDVMPRGLAQVPATMKLLVGVLTESLVVLLVTVLVQWRHHATKPADKDSPPPPPPTSAAAASVVRVAPSASSQCDAAASSQRSSRAQFLVSRDRSKECGRQVWWDGQSLDRVFFFLAFVVNTVFLVAFVFEGL